MMVFFPSLFLLGCLFHLSQGVPTTIGGDILLGATGVPSLGRGYSITTNTFQSSCLDVGGNHTETSYNYDCKLFTRFMDDSFLTML